MTLFIFLSKICGMDKHDIAYNHQMHLKTVFWHMLFSTQIPSKINIYACLPLKKYISDPPKQPRQNPTPKSSNILPGQGDL